MISTKFLFIKSFSFSFYAQSLKFTFIFAPTQMLHSILPNPKKNSRCLKEKTNKAGVTGDFVQVSGESKSRLTRFWFPEKEWVEIYMLSKIAYPDGKSRKLKWPST